MLWPRGAQVRAESLRVTNPYARIADPDRLLLSAAIARPSLEVQLSATNWFEELSQLLVQYGTAELVGSIGSSPLLADALVRLGCEPIDASALLVFARLIGVRREGEELRAAFELPEAFQ
jgi:hypothetical protein